MEVLTSDAESRGLKSPVPSGDATRRYIAFICHNTWIKIHVYASDVATRHKDIWICDPIPR